MSDDLERSTSTAGNPDAVGVAVPEGEVGLPDHLPRPTDVDPDAEKRAERQIATFFGLSTLMAVLFCVAYFVFEIGENPDVILGYGASNVTLGLTLGLALLFIGIGAIQWSRKLMNDTEIIEMRHPVRSSNADREEAVTAFETGVDDTGIARRPMIRNSLLGAMGFLALPAVVLLRDLGPLPGRALYHTVWEEGMRVVNDVSGIPVRPEDIRIGQLVNAEPEIFYNGEPYGEEAIEGHEELIEKGKAAIIVVRMQPDEITPAAGRENWGVGGILAYSKICTHVGCPISLWEQQTHHLLCPCHQSTFDLADNGKVVFGPAARALPQLPLAVDEDGYLIATSDFREPVGPSFWERG
ncbi:MAG TPA: Rieske 2Fe-2S domain-containing protein [Marmoricola sp.]|nr:Rieske 2Fe-2S domain-containing protein [Marmoricola sp.]